jgi:hypothetical protein
MNERYSSAAGSACAEVAHREATGPDPGEPAYPADRPRNSPRSSARNCPSIKKTIRAALGDPTLDVRGGMTADARKPARRSRPVASEVAS